MLFPFSFAQLTVTKRLCKKRPPPSSSSREVRLRVPIIFSAVYFSRGTLPTKKGERTGTLSLGVLATLFQLKLLGERGGIEGTRS